MTTGNWISVLTQSIRTASPEKGSTTQPPAAPATPGPLLASVDSLASPTLDVGLDRQGQPPGTSGPGHKMPPGHGQARWAEHPPCREPAAPGADTECDSDADEGRPLLQPATPARAPSTPRTGASTSTGRSRRGSATSRAGDCPPAATAPFISPALWPGGDDFPPGAGGSTGPGATGAGDGSRGPGDSLWLNSEFVMYFGDRHPLSEGLAAGQSRYRLQEDHVAYRVCVFFIRLLLALGALAGLGCMSIGAWTALGHRTLEPLPAAVLLARMGALLTMVGGMLAAAGMLSISKISRLIKRRLESSVTRCPVETDLEEEEEEEEEHGAALAQEQADALAGEEACRCAEFSINTTAGGGPGLEAGACAGCLKTVMVPRGGVRRALPPVASLGVDSALTSTGGSTGCSDSSEDLLMMSGSMDFEAPSAGGPGAVCRPSDGDGGINPPGGLNMCKEAQYLARKVAPLEAGSNHVSVSARNPQATLAELDAAGGPLLHGESPDAGDTARGLAKTTKVMIMEARLTNRYLNLLIILLTSMVCVAVIVGLTAGWNIYQQEISQIDITMSEIWDKLPVPVRGFVQERLDCCGMLVPDDRPAPSPECRPGGSRPEPPGSPSPLPEVVACSDRVKFMLSRHDRAVHAMFALGGLSAMLIGFACVGFILFFVVFSRRGRVVANAQR
ncbi:hypothetical protein H696_02269 [Fonticula alba]|uniref:Tetraspanin n=1 Tax=Fonticula alba TaxID=691883 RepID=A0A058ZAE6_FONAL|nr:hypothetical protein H696_02269 [Fonticula alba]KCV71324.1 hypothetical protein H696_02269 [Fonticula alba]|eukprot:XP_009494447.1 hypothetical protein H696_02269 [Fonticula alba]